MTYTVIDVPWSQDSYCPARVARLGRANVSFDNFHEAQQEALSRSFVDLAVQSEVHVAERRGDRVVGFASDGRWNTMEVEVSR